VHTERITGQSNQINIRLIGKIPQLTQTQKWFTKSQCYMMGEEQNKRHDN